MFVELLGVTGPEILFGQVVTQFLVMTGQTVMVLVVAFAVFKITCEGDVGLVTALTILTGFCGMCFGKCSTHHLIEPCPSLHFTKEILHELKTSHAPSDRTLKVQSAPLIIIAF
jgi:hypothetical protein